MNFSTITPDKPSNFGQSLKVTVRVNWIKGAFSKYNKKSAFGIFTDPFPRSNLTSTTRIPWSVLSPSINNIGDNIYRYFPRHCANGGSQLKGIDFYQSYSPVLEAPTIRLIIVIDYTYHLTIVIADVTNNFHNTLKDSYGQ